MSIENCMSDKSKTCKQKNSCVLQQRLRSTMPEVTVGVMQELARRGAIKAAIAGREGASLKGLLTFIQKYTC